MSKKCVYAGSSLLATIAPTATTYQYPDHLSTRAETDSSGNTSSPYRTFGHLPFGDIWYETGTPSKWKFTSYERDAESDPLDYAIFRYDQWRYGRFMSPDPVGGDINNPESLNRYEYVLDQPTIYVDPLGLESQCVTIVIVIVNRRTGEIVQSFVGGYICSPDLAGGATIVRAQDQAGKPLTPQDWQRVQAIERCKQAVREKYKAEFVLMARRTGKWGLVAAGFGAFGGLVGGKTLASAGAGAGLGFLAAVSIVSGTSGEKMLDQLNIDLKNCEQNPGP